MCLFSIKTVPELSVSKTNIQLNFRLRFFDTTDRIRTFKYQQGISSLNGT